MNEYILPLDPSKRSTDTLDFQSALRAKIVGQEEGDGTRNSYDGAAQNRAYRC